MFRPTCLAVLLSIPTAAAADPVTIGSLKAAPPGEWKAEKPANRLRSYQFRLPSGADGVADAEVIVREQSKKPDAEFPRWKDEMDPPDGKASSFEVGTATVHVLDATGTWKYKPFPQAKKEEPRPGYRVVWVIVEQKDAATQVRLSGPKEVVEKYKPGFDDWLKALK